MNKTEIAQGNGIILTNNGGVMLNYSHIALKGDPSLKRRNRIRSQYEEEHSLHTQDHAESVML